MATAAIVTLALLTSACTTTPSAPTGPVAAVSGRMRVVADLAKCAKQPSTVIVMLPGAYTQPEQFTSEGFVAAVRRQGIAADILLADAHVGYFENNSIVERLSEDVLLPARAFGYKQIWLVGISNGGAAAILTAERVPKVADGIVLLAPYLGTRTIAQQIRGKGGLRQWEPPTPFDRTDGDQVMWRWLKQQVAASESAAQRGTPDLYLGYGVSDLYVFNHRTLGAAMPPSHVVDTGGGHDWAAWRTLWDRILPGLPLERDASCAR